MLPALFLTLVLAPAPLPCPHPPLCQDDAPKVDERPEVKAMIEELGTHVKAKGEKDQEAIGVLDKLLEEFSNSGPKDRQSIAKAVADCFDVKRTKELEEGVPDDRLYKAAATVLGRMAPESVKFLIPLIGDKTHRKNMSLQQTLTIALGKTKSVDGLKTLQGLLKHKDAAMQASGAEALANFSEAPEATRKLIFEDLLNTLMDQFTKKDQNPADSEAQERWNTISGPILETLQKITGHNETSPEQWLRWWNDNKKKPWGEKSG